MAFFLLVPFFCCILFMEVIVSGGWCVGIVLHVLRNVCFQEENKTIP